MKSVKLCAHGLARLSQIWLLKEIVSHFEKFAYFPFLKSSVRQFSQYHSHISAVNMYPEQTASQGAQLSMLEQWYRSSLALSRSLINTLYLIRLMHPNLQRHVTLSRNGQLNFLVVHSVTQLVSLNELNIFVTHVMQFVVNKQDFKMNNVINVVVNLCQCHVLNS